MLRSQFFCLVVIFFILINTDLSEAKGGRGGGRGRSRGGGWSGGSSGGPIYWEIFFYVACAAVGMILLVRLCFCLSDYCDDDENDSNQHLNQRSIAMAQNRQRQQNNVNEAAINLHRSIVTEHNRQQPQSNVNETDISQSISHSRKQFLENLPQNSYHGTKLSPTHLSYPIAPRNVPSNGLNQPNSISETISMPPTYLPQQLPSAPENHNLNTNYNEQNGLISSSTHLPYPITPYDAPPPYPGNPNGAWINGSWENDL